MKSWERHKKRDEKLQEYFIKKNVPWEDGMSNRVTKKEKRKYNLYMKGKNNLGMNKNMKG